jgi:hypothetical protein
MKSHVEGGNDFSSINKNIDLYHSPHSIYRGTDTNKLVSRKDFVAPRSYGIRDGWR